MVQHSLQVIFSWFALVTMVAAPALAAEGPAAAGPLWVEIAPENFQVAPGVYRVPLHWAEPAGVARVHEPTRFGVPVPRSVLRDAAAVRLEDDRGQERNIQVEPAAYWPDGSYKWIILDTTLDLPAHGKATWHLSLGNGITRSQPASPLRITEDDEQVTVDTGVLRFVLLKERNEFIHAAWLDQNGDGKYGDDEQIVAPPLRNETRGLFVDLQRVLNGQRWRRGGGMHWAVIEPKPEQFRIEAAGPLCAEFKYEGWHHSDANVDMDPWVNVAARAFKYVLRIRAYAGSSTLRVFHTFINTEDPRDIRVRSIGLRLPLTLQGEPRYTFGSDPTLHAATADPYFLVQDHWNSFHFEKLDGADAKKPPAILKQGEISEGWADISTAQRGLTMVFRDMVKLFPKELGFHGNEAIAYAWPAHKRPTKYEYFWGGNGAVMDLRQTNELDDPEITAFKTEYADLYQRHMVGADSDWERYNLVPDRCSALGVGKTHELLYDFHSGAVQLDRARDLAIAASNPVQPFVTPQWYCWTTEAFGRQHPYDPANFPALELAFERFIDWCHRHQNEWSHWLGMFDYGDMQTFHKPEGYPEKFGPWGKFMGRYGWLNGEYNNDFEFFLSYFRTGRATDFQLARAYAAHRMDVDTCNYHPHPAWVGAQHRHSIQHWSDWLIDQQTFNDGIAALYYTTGDRRARDVALLVGDFAMYSNFPYWHDKYDGNYSAHRGSWTRLANIARAYEMNPVPKTRRYIDRFIAMVNQHLEPFGGPQDGVGTGPYMGAAFPLAYHVTESPAIRKLIEETGFTYGGGSTLGNFGAYFALQYQFTRDTGPFVIAGIPTAARRGTPEALAKIKETPLEPGTFNTARNSGLGYTYHMSAMYDARYDDRTTVAPASVPVAPEDGHYQMLDLRAQMNRDAFGHTTSGTPLPWPENGQILGLRQTLLTKGGKLEFCGSGMASLSGDQDITTRLKPGQLPWTNWSTFPTTGLHTPTLRRSSPPPPLWNWGPVPFSVIDSRQNGGVSMIGVRHESKQIPVGVQARKLYFLGHVFATRYDQPLGAPPMLALLAQKRIGEYRVHYADGSVQEVPLINRENMTPWIYGRAAPSAPFVYGSPGATNNVWPGQGGVAAFELEVDPTKRIDSIEFVSSDPHKELLLYAITALVDGAKPKPAEFLFAFRTEASRTEKQEMIAGLQEATETQSGWLNSDGVKVGQDSTYVSLPFDGRIPRLRLRVAGDSWYRVNCYTISRHDSVNAIIFANGMVMFNHRDFFAQARDGVIDLAFLCRGPSNTDKETGIALRTLTLTPVDGAPAGTFATIDPAELVQYGWAAEMKSQHGAMRDATLRLQPPPGRYRLSIQFTTFLGNAGVKFDLTPSSPSSGQAIDDFPVNSREPATFELDVDESGIAIQIAVDPNTSTGRIQSWGLDRVLLERLD
jgi:hypothetical protein